MKKYTVAALLIIATVNAHQITGAISRQAKITAFSTIAIAPLPLIGAVYTRLKSADQFWAIIRKGTCIDQNGGQHTLIAGSREKITALILTTPLAAGCALYQYIQLRKERLGNKEQS